MLLLPTWMMEEVLSRGSGESGRHVQGDQFMSNRNQGFQRQSDGKGYFSLTPRELGERWASLATFFLALGLVDFAAGDAWNLIAQAQAWGFRLVSPAEGTSARAPARSN